MRVMELHAPLKIVQRSKGRTATAAAAYRAAAKIECERTGQVHDYTKKRGIEHTELMAAPDAPDWTRDRSKLWNAAETHEKHPRAQTARELEIAFPHEFTHHQRLEAGRGIAAMLVNRYGCAADIAWHQPNRNGDQRNHHAHILFTARAITAEGWAKNKHTALDDVRAARDEKGEVRREVVHEETGKTKVVTNAMQELRALRAGVAAVMNDIAARDKVDVCVEHLSFKERGLNKQATQHMGPNATEMERRGEDTEIGNKNRGITLSNADREKLQEQYDNIIDFALAREKFRQRSAWEIFYRETMHERAALVQHLEKQFGQQESENRDALERLAREDAARGLFGRLWHRVTGRRKAEQQMAAAHAAVLREIEKQKRIAHEKFEAERRVRLEKLKEQIARADGERYEAFLAKQKEHALAMEREAREEEAQEARENKLKEAAHAAFENREERTPADLPPTGTAPQDAARPANDAAERRSAYMRRAQARRAANSKDPGPMPGE